MKRTCKKCGADKAQRDSGRWVCRPCENAYQRRRYAEDPEPIRRAKREHMARVRATPEGRARQSEIAKRCRENGGAERDRARRRHKKRERFFEYHVQFVRRYNADITASDLRGMWESQGGLCGLTGQPMEKAAGRVNVDHIVPSSRGGSDGLENLRWVTSEANRAKGALTDDEFVDLCRQVAEWIGHQIMAAHTHGER